MGKKKPCHPETMNLYNADWCLDNGVHYVGIGEQCPTAKPSNIPDNENQQSEDDRNASEERYGLDAEKRIERKARYT